MFCLLFSGGILFLSVSGFFLDYLNEDLSYQTQKIARIVENYDPLDADGIKVALKKLPLIINSETVVFDSKFAAVAAEPPTAEVLLSRLSLADRLKVGRLATASGVIAGAVPAERRVFCAVPFTGTGAFRGGILASVNFNSSESRRKKAGRQVAFALLAAFLIAPLVGYFLSGWLARPLAGIREASAAFASGDFKKRIPVASADEIGRTAAVLNDMAGRIDALISLQREFLADVSHEFKTPLTSIRGSAEALSDGIVTDEKEVAAYLSRIVSETNALSSLVNDILEISRLESGTAAIEAYPVDASAALQRAVDDLSGAASARGIKIESTLARSADGVASNPAGGAASVPVVGAVMVMAEEKRLGRVFRNLVENAINHSPENARLRIRHRETPSSVEFFISDCGAGVPAELRERLFERFFRMEYARSRNSGGTGLGLSICRKTVEAFGGKIAFIDPEEGFSTTVSFSLPKNLTEF